MMDGAAKKGWLLFTVMLMGLVTAEATRAATLWEVSNVTELTQAIAELKATCPNGGTIILAPGTYLMTDTVEFNSIPQVNLIGRGWNTVWQKVGGGDAIVFTNSSFSAVRNMKIVGDQNATAGSGIVFRGQGSSSCTVDYCRIVMFATSGIRFEGTAEYPLSGNTVSDCHFISNLQHQLYSYYNNDFYITGNQFGYWQTDYPQTGAFLDHSSAGTYTRNYHWDNVVAFRMTGANYNRIENNRFEESRKEGIIIGDPNGSDWCGFNVFIGNTIHTNSKSLSEGFTAVVAYYAGENTFSANQIFSWDSEQYLMKRCLEVGTGCSNWVITDNIMRHNAEQPALLYSTNVGHIVKDNMMD